ncbi:MAG: class I SAM-dependent methyltransferase [Candidatus Delongbacteria bacterium]|nr:class I SAM-dependent methyltransferase [Candidatus Delongbacteria bacterium]MBN2836818.1 class I SAM-dependent methyltransferase [Candidatus Delongbacteria bacterium]
MDNIRKIISDSYTKNSESRNHDEIQNWKIDEVKRFEEIMNKNGFKTILDIGCGSGIFGKIFQDLNFSPFCIDFSEGMVDLAIKRGLDAKLMDFYNLDFADCTFDSVWSMNTLLHVPKSDLVNVLSEIKRVIRDNGFMFLGLYGGWSFEGFWDKDFYKPNRFFSFYEDNEIISYIEKIFKIEDFRSYDVGREGFNFQSMILKKK